MNTTSRTTSIQPPVTAPKCCVLYLENGREKRTAWMSRERAHEAATLMRAKYGERNAIVYVD
ncbi:hypothetical protein [Marinobacter nauticus]|uniref:hypothetical protein n=1 Tax=Marinobacter nauticus TaxID=2743 RepID=UPI0005A09D0C|nr:hypothetical protein [Marinobacter nauticus]